MAKRYTIRIRWSRKWQPTSVFLPRKSCGQRTWWATVHRVAESDMTEHPHNNNSIRTRAFTAKGGAGLKSYGVEVISLLPGYTPSA